MVARRQGKKISPLGVKLFSLTFYISEREWHIYLFWSDEFFFFKARFIATICQNFNRELLLDSVSPFFSSSVWPHDPWCQLCKLRISMLKAVVDMSHIISVVRDETFITLGSSYYTCAFHKFHWQEIRIATTQARANLTRKQGNI